MGCAAVAILVPVAFMVTCFVASPGPSSSQGSTSAGSLRTADCKGYGQGRDGWLVDHDERGEVALWAKPAQRSAGNQISATVEVIGRMITTVTEECYMPDGILYYHILFDESRSGWVDVEYLSWKRP